MSQKFCICCLGKERFPASHLRKAALKTSCSLSICTMAGCAAKGGKNKRLTTMENLLLCAKAKTERLHNSRDRLPLQAMSEIHCKLQLQKTYACCAGAGQLNLITEACQNRIKPQLPRQNREDTGPGRRSIGQHALFHLHTQPFLLIFSPHDHTAR